MHLQKIVFSPIDKEKRTTYPFHLPFIQDISELTFTKPVTFFVGENGTGKSTIIESIAALINATTIGAEPIATDKTLDAARRLSAYMKPRWKQKKQRGFFLRSEDFFQFVKKQAVMRAEFLANIEEIEKEYENKSVLAKNLAKMPHARSLHEMTELYGEDLDANSHGESFLKVFSSRIIPNGLYILDEPEAALSPMRQLTFIAMLKDAIAEGSQFIIATHSPILLAFPNAAIWSFDDSLKEVAYNELEHVQFIKAFLNRPEQFLRHL